MKKYFVIGNPIEHSLSPKLHNYWIKQNKIDAFYDKKKLNKNDIQGIISEVKNEKIHGLNVTVPYKNFVIPDRSVNNPWMQLLLSTSGLHNNHHYNPSSYNLKMTDKWYEQDFLNVFLIEKFLKA